MEFSNPVFYMFPQIVFKILKSLILKLNPKVHFLNGIEIIDFRRHPKVDFAVFGLYHDTLEVLILAWYIHIYIACTHLYTWLLLSIATCISLYIFCLSMFVLNLDTLEVLYVYSLLDHRVYEIFHVFVTSLWDMYTCIHC